ncbi:hypothetical protein C8R47DRAFT_1141911 [Mycena vitilis]|nr:hypothetical protein C8R47DRAFT_1141911 [Mycena vitilis]
MAGRSRRARWGQRDRVCVSPGRRRDGPRVPPRRAHRGSGGGGRCPRAARERREEVCVFLFPLFILLLLLRAREAGCRRGAGGARATIVFSERLAAIPPGATVLGERLARIRVPAPTCAGVEHGEARAEQRLERLECEGRRGEVRCREHQRAYGNRVSTVEGI